MTSTGYTGDDARALAGERIAIGLIADSDLPAEIVEHLAKKLPDLLRERVDPRIDWQVSLERKPLPVHQRPKALINIIREWREEQGWDLAICLTDIPFQAEGHPVVAEASGENGVGLISLPALGPANALRRTRGALVTVVRELLAQREDVSRDGDGASDGDRDGARAAPRRARREMRREPSSAGVRFVTPPARGTLRLLAGMVRANRPWRLVLGLLSALTAAAATAALANLNSTVWRVALALSPLRLLLINVISLAIMIAWLIVVHRLWRRPSERMTRRQAMLFNLTTFFTLLIGVGTLYAGLFAFNVLTGALVIDSRPLQTTAGHPVGVGDYLRLAWFVASLATVGGALGSGLESNRAVRAAAYRYQAQQSDD
jgi:hypothetical protein